MADAIEPWQRKDFEALDSGWRNLIGQPVSRPQLRAYLERPRGHSKTADIALMASWALWASPRKLAGIVGAGSRDQAGFVRDAIQRLVQLNPWLGLTVNNWEVGHPATGSTLDIIASDAATSYGQTPDFVICDELTHWAGDKGKDFWTSLMSSSAKRPHCLLVVIANAGHGKGRSWQWKLREQARGSPEWYFSRLDGPQASWITPATLAEQRRLLVAPQEYNRLWENLWQTGEGDALDPADLAACCTLRRPQKPDSRHEFVAGLDLGLKKDHAALVVLAVSGPDQKIRLASCRSWAPDKDTGEIDLRAVEEACWQAEETYRLAALYYDPWQAALMAQRLRDRGLHMVEQAFIGTALNRIALALLEVFKTRTIELYEDHESKLLIKDLSRLQIVQKSYGFKLESSRDDDGHADRATALALALPQALAFMIDLKQEDAAEERVEI